MSLDHPTYPAIPGQAADGATAESVQSMERVSPRILESQAAFHRDLPDLLAQHRGKWVAYHGQTRVGLSDSKARLYQQCLTCGLRKGEFVVRSIEPAEPWEVVFDS